MTIFHVKGGKDFQISMKEELPEHIQSGYAYFGDKRVVLTKFHKIILEGKIPGNHLSCEGMNMTQFIYFAHHILTLTSIAYK